MWPEGGRFWMSLGPEPQGFPRELDERTFFLWMDLELMRLCVWERKLFGSPKLSSFCCVFVVGKGIVGRIRSSFHYLDHSGQIDPWSI